VVTEWEGIQEDLKTKIVQEDTEEWQKDPDLKGLKYIAGLDISYPVLPEGIAPAVPADVKTEDDNENGVKTKPHDSSAAYVAIAVHSFPDLKLVYSDIQCVNLFVPYIPGFLAFRECQPLVDAVQKLIKAHPEWTPNVLLVDGNGILHPQQAGLASHVGFQTNLPCIGVSKNLFFFEGIEYRKSMGQNMNKTGDYINLREGSDKILGMALKTANEAKNPVYVSIGHRISLETARRVVLACSKYRIPEPIRTADHMSREFIRQLDQEQSQQ
jgi:deoxyinosine 3'endonuclease (endonuclease V)